MADTKVYPVSVSVLETERVLLLLNSQPILPADGRVRMLGLYRGLGLPVSSSNPLMASQHFVLSLSGSLGLGA